MSNEIKEIIEKAIREAFEAGYNDGYLDGVHDRGINDVVSSKNPGYILTQNTHWAEYQKTLNTPKPS